MIAYRCRLLFALVVAMGCYFTVSAGEGFSRDAWLRAPAAQGQNWSREGLLRQLAASTEFAGLTRQRVMDLLGMPGFASEDYYPGSGRTGRIDVYRLSAKNSTSYRIDYDSGDKVTGHFIEQEPCRCESCNVHAPAVPLGVLTGTLLKKDAAMLGKTLTLPQVEKLLGLQGQRSFLQNTVGGRVWVDYSGVWTIAGTEHRFLVVSGHAPAGPPSVGETPFGALGGMQLSSYSVIYMAPGCLAP